MKLRRCLFGTLSLTALGVVCGRQDQTVDGSAPPIVKTAQATLLVNPYIQLGHAAPERVGRDLVLLWHAADVEAAWVVEYQTAVAAAWGLGPDSYFTPDCDTGYQRTPRFPSHLRGSSSRKRLCVSCTPQ